MTSRILSLGSSLFSSNAVCLRARARVCVYACARVCIIMYVVVCHCVYMCVCVCVCVCAFPFTEEHYVNNMYHYKRGKHLNFFFNIPRS